MYKSPKGGSIECLEIHLRRSQFNAIELHENMDGGFISKWHQG
jgi:hypothetical protein